MSVVEVSVPGPSRSVSHSASWSRASVTSVKERTLSPSGSERIRRMTGALESSTFQARTTMVHQLELMSSAGYDNVVYDVSISRCLCVSTIES